jgi:hypothetical protein
LQPPAFFIAESGACGPMRADDAAQAKSRKQREMLKDSPGRPSAVPASAALFL